VTGAELRSAGEFAAHLIGGLAVPVLADGYADLVEQLRQSGELARSAPRLGLDAVLTGDDPILTRLRKSNRELVTEAEREAELLMRQAVAERYPDHAIVGEEHGYRPGGQDRWVFDPIDGTSALVRTAMADAYGLQPRGPRPSFGTTAALVSRSEAVLGVVTELRANEGTLEAVDTWIGIVGEPTTRNGRAVHPPAHPATLAEARLACTVPEVMFNTPVKWSGFQALLDATAGCVTDQNCIGFVRLLRSDEGVQVVYEADLAYHDAAALVPVLRGVGIEATDEQGGELDFDESRIGCEFRLLAAAPELHAAALQALRQGVPAEASRFKGSAPTHQGYVQKFSPDPVATMRRRMGHG
jgi:inositol-phosphate phosphatase / L-galactose 1-phosphate phosphatase / histidinol-phosphatase